MCDYDICDNCAYTYPYHRFIKKIRVKFKILWTIIGKILLCNDLGWLWQHDDDALRYNFLLICNIVCFFSRPNSTLLKCVRSQINGH